VRDFDAVEQEKEMNPEDDIEIPDIEDFEVFNNAYIPVIELGSDFRKRSNICHHLNMILF